VHIYNPVKTCEPNPNPKPNPNTSTKPSD
jgi:hypothetical protein